MLQSKKIRKEQVNRWKVCLKVFPLIHFQMPARNAEKNIFTYVWLRSRQFKFDRAKRIASDHTSAAWVAVFFKAIQERKMSTSLTLSSPKRLKIRKRAMQDTSCWNLIRAFCGVEMNLFVAYKRARGRHMDDIIPWYRKCIFLKASSFLFESNLYGQNFYFNCWLLKEPFVCLVFFIFSLSWGLAFARDYQWQNFLAQRKLLVLFL